MGRWLTIEVQDAEVPASLWRSGRGGSLTEAAATNGATDWRWATPTWGVTLEVEFPDETAREAFRALPGVRATLDAVPDPVEGLYVYPGRGGGARCGPRLPRRPAPIAGAATAEEPHEQFLEMGAARPSAD